MLEGLRGNASMEWLQFGGAECLESYGVSLRQGWAGFMADFTAAVPPEHVRFLEGLRVHHREGGWLFTHAGLNPYRPLAAMQTVDCVHGHRRFLDWPEPLEDGVRVVHGHWVSKDVVVRAHRVGVDTGCGFPGGRLSAVAVDVAAGTVRVLGG